MIRSRIGRRWRSVSFRSGMWSAVSVGLVASIALFVVVVVVFFAFALEGAVAQIGLVDRAEDQLQLGVEPAELDLESTWDAASRPQEEASDGFWVVLSEGVIVNSDGNVDQEVLGAEFSDNDFAADAETPERPEDVLGIKTVGDRDWLYFERPVVAPDGMTYQIITAYEGTFGLWTFARRSLPVAIPIIVVLMGVSMAVTSWLTRRALRRVEHMRAELELITQQSLDRRVPTVNASDGIEKLAHTMNDLLVRLQTSTAQQSQFLADASHELRSPVAGLLAQLDVATTYPSRVEPKVLLPKLRDEAQRLQHLVDDLLFLSRAEADDGSTSSGFTVVAVDSLIAAEVAHQNNTGKSVRFAVGDPVAAVVDGNPRDLERALRNLVDNAVRHCEHEVRIDTNVTGGNVMIRVADDGPGVAAEEAEQIFKRFVRLDEARSRDAGGAGLGLAIAREIVTNHGGTVRLAQSSTGGTAFELSLPESNRPVRV